MPRSMGRRAISAHDSSGHVVGPAGTAPSAAAARLDRLGGSDVPPGPGVRVVPPPLQKARTVSVPPDPMQLLPAPPVRRPMQVPEHAEGGHRRRRVVLSWTVEDVRGLIRAWFGRGSDVVRAWFGPGSGLGRDSGGPGLGAGFGRVLGWPRAGLGTVSTRLIRSPSRHVCCREQVCDWLTSVGLAPYADTFALNEVDGSSLGLLQPRDVASLIASDRDHEAFLSALARLRASSP